LTWLGSSAALAILSFDVDAESPILAVSRRYAEHPSAMSHQRYGPLVAVPRLLGLLKDLGVPATFFVPGWTAERYPESVERILAAGQEVAHHGHSHRSPVHMDEAEERRDLEAGLAALERHGVQPEGYRTPSWEPSTRTFDLLAEYGIAYDSSLMDDDRPYVLETASGALVELPAHWRLDDWSQYMHLPDPRSGSGTVHPPSRAIQVWREELDGMRRHGGLFVLTMHPFLSGRPGRVEGLRGLVEHALDAGDVEFVSCAEAARRAREDLALPRRPLPVLEVDPAVYPE
jgi:peptidoglycan/xylan/chitin deacetylase (PgdA/CDA1 family)